MCPKCIAKPVAGGGQVPPLGEWGFAARGQRQNLPVSQNGPSDKNLSRQRCAWWGMVCPRVFWCGFFHQRGFSIQDTRWKQWKKEGAGEPYCKPDPHVWMEINLAAEGKAKPECVTFTLLAQLLRKYLDSNTVGWLNKSFFFFCCILRQFYKFSRLVFC